MFKSELIKTDVTAVKLTNNRILAGVGNFLNIFDHNGEYIKKIKIFDGHKIHGIELNEKNVLLHGGCNIQTLQCDFTSNQIVKLKDNKINDWILTTRWLKNNFVAVIVMKNKLVVCDSNLQVVRQIVCQDSCILYSAFIVYNQINELVVLSGTVFGQILVWKTNLEESNQSCRVLATLKGHNGVIFSVHYNQTPGFICSSSDDRCSILWSVANKCLHKELTSPTPTITLLRKFYGHHSRIFRCLVLNSTLLTAGEDSYVNVWNFEGELLNKIATHQGGPVWAIDSDNEMVVSGGGGCGVLLTHIRCDSICQRLAMPDGETPKRIGLLRKCIVVVTEKGILYCYVRESESWVKVGQHEDLKSYSILEVSKCRNMVSLSGYHGEIYIYQEQLTHLELRSTFKLDNQSRICSFHWLSCSTFLTCEHTGVLTLWFLHTHQILPITHFQLPESKEMWTTSACQGPNARYIVGDRRGNIYVYGLKTKTPIQIIKKAHNHLGITQLQSDGNRVVSMGRDGSIKTFLLGDQMELLSMDKVPFTWLIKSVDDLLLAFSGNVFVVWDYKSRKTLLEHLCGGGHRSWDFQNEDPFTFIYVKERMLYVVKWDKKTVCPINVVGDYHLNTINSICVELVDDHHVVLSGSEDTTLRISIIGKDHFRCVQNVKSHLSSIKAVCLHRLTKNSFLMFSGGGRGQMICWKVFLNKNGGECHQESSYYEKTTEELSESEIRIMDLKTLFLENVLLLFSACSDGNVNVFRLENDTKHNFHLMTKLFRAARCVSRILILTEVNVLITMSTDGMFVFWDLSQILTQQPLTPFKTMKVHQSGVIGCRFRFLGDNLGVLLSGGDDGCIVMNLFRIEKNSESVSFSCVDQFRDVGTHCAQVSGTWISEKYFFTTGVDQKVVVFKWGVNKDCRLECSFVGRYNSAVADIQGMECREDGEYFHAFLYGKGVEYLKVAKRTLL